MKESCSYWQEGDAVLLSTADFLPVRGHLSTLGADTSVWRASSWLWITWYPPSSLGNFRMLCINPGSLSAMVRHNSRSSPTSIIKMCSYNNNRVMYT